MRSVDHRLNELDSIAKLGNKSRTSIESVPGVIVRVARGQHRHENIFAVEFVTPAAKVNARIIHHVIT